MFLGHPLSWLLCAAHAAIGGPVPAWPSGDEYIMVVATFGPRLLVGGPMSEEFGWRGYAMNALTDRLKRRAASLIVGAAWGL